MLHTKESTSGITDHIGNKTECALLAFSKQLGGDYEATAVTIVDIAISLMGQHGGLSLMGQHDHATI